MPALQPIPDCSPDYDYFAALEMWRTAVNSADPNPEHRSWHLTSGDNGAVTCFLVIRPLIGRAKTAYATGGTPRLAVWNVVYAYFG